MSKQSRELIKELLDQGILDKDEAEKQLAELDAKEPKSEAKAEVKTEAAKTAETEKSEVDVAPALAAISGKEKAKEEKRGGHETLGAFAARVFMSEIELKAGEKTSVKDLIDGIKAVKIKDKAFDLVRYLAKGGNLSKYTCLGLRELEKGSCIKASAFAYALENGIYGTHYSEGTARAQSQQINSLFKTFRIIGEDSMAIDDSPVLKTILAKRGKDIVADVLPEVSKEMAEA